MNIFKDIKKFMEGITINLFGEPDPREIYVCNECNYMWKSRNAVSGSYKCPRCNSKWIRVSEV